MSDAAEQDFKFSPAIVQACRRLILLLIATLAFAIPANAQTVKEVGERRTDSQDSLANRSAGQVNPTGESMARTKAAPGEKTGATRKKADKASIRNLSGDNPIIRIGLMEEYDRIDFTLTGNYDMLTLTGELIESNVKPKERWHVLPDQTVEARAIFSILTTAFANKDEADNLRRDLSARNYQARVAEVGEQIYIDERQVMDNLKYRVLVGRYATQREAAQDMEEFKDEFVPRIVRQIQRPATGTIELANAQFKSERKIKDGFRLKPKADSCCVTLHDVREGTGFQWEREVDRQYPGLVEIRIDHRGLLMAMTELPLEQYLQGVVPSEMPASYPLEALKAQAVAARSEVLAKIGMKHPNDPFDLCAHVHCQAYSGVTNMHERTNKAVDDTRGMVLFADGQVAEAVYSACCGGHTEDKLNVWNPPDAAHLKGKWDAAPKADIKKKMDLSREADLERWVKSLPDVWCNVSKYPSLPPALQKAEAVFRWEVNYSRRELEDIIHRKTGEDIGELVAIVPLQRGVSGRLMEIEILGTRRTLRIQRELNIRNTLSLQYLRSAAFSIEVDYSEDGRPVNFHLYGAGWGHGVGMCQTGAGVMASKNLKFKTILEHYYPGTTVERVYGK